MRILFFASLLVLLFPLSGCDSTGIDSGEPCYTCGANGGDGGDGDDQDGGGDDDKDDDGGDNDGGNDDGGDGGNDDGGDGDGGNDDGSDDGGNGRFVEVNPTTTYLRVSLDGAEDAVGDARAIPLSEIDISPGEAVCFRTLGDFYYVDNLRASERGYELITAVFSSTDELGHRNDKKRVLGALEAGSDVYTADTFLGGQITNIDEDFAVTDVCLTVPNDARYIFFSATDDVFNDNVDVRENDQPFGVLVEK